MPRRFRRRRSILNFVFVTIWYKPHGFGFSVRRLYRQRNPARPLDAHEMEVMMLSLLAQITLPSLSAEATLSLFSATITAYFWLIKARQERPKLKVFQLRDFRASCRRGDPQQNTKRLCVTQVDDGGVMIANDSTRQNSIVRFDCFVKDQGRWLKGSWGYMENDKPPWNIAPESAISLSLACFFEVPEHFETPEELDFRVEFITVSGQRFPHRFSLKAPDL